MKLPFSLPFGKKEKPQYYLSLLLRDEKANAVIFEEFQGKARVVGEHEEYFNESIETATLDEWLEVLDKTISIAEKVLPPNEETHNTIFGVKGEWIEDTRIKKEYLQKLKKVCEELDLNPLGFIVIHEAITTLLKEEEGVPISAILVEVERHGLAVSLLRGGRILETKRTRSEGSLSETIDRLLHHFTKYEVLPSRIILFDGRDTESLSHTLTGHTWSKSLPFLHVPTVTTLPKGFDAKAVLIGAAGQMGFEVLEGVETISHAPTASEEIPDTSVEEEAKPIDAAIETEAVHETTEENPTSFGFVRDRDILATEEPAISEKKASEEVEVEQQPVQPVVPATHQQKTTQKISSLQLPAMFAPIALLLGKIPIHTIGTHIRKVGARFPKISGGPMGKLIFLPPGLLLIGIFFLLFYVFGLKATVMVDMKPEVVDQSQSVTFSQSSATDLSKGIIQGEIVTITEDGSVTTATTGIKEIGEKAKGTVTIYNSSLTESRNFPKGTTITAGNNLDFVLDADIKIASASGDASAITSSKAQVAVVAKAIGKEYNLPSGTRFTFGSIPSVTIIAKNDTAFSGGSKKEVTVVGKKDIETLLTELPKKLEAKAKNDLTEKIGEGKDFMPFFVSQTLTKKDIDKDVGEEATTVGLKGTVTFGVLTYEKHILDEFSKNKLQESVKTKMLTKEGVTYTVEDSRKKGEKDVSAILHMKAAFIPKLAEEEIRKNIAGKSFDEVKALLTKMPQVSSVTIELSPPLPFLPSLLPRKADNIVIILTNG